MRWQHVEASVVSFRSSAKLPVGLVLSALALMIGSAISAREKVGQWAAAHWLLWELEAMKVLAGCWSGAVEQKAVRLLRKLPILPLLHVLARGDLRRQVTKQSVIAHSLAKQRPRIQPI